MGIMLFALLLFGTQSMERDMEFLHVNRIYKQVSVPYTGDYGSKQ